MAKLLYQPSEERIKQSNMYRFMNFINERFDKNYQKYGQLHQWSIDNIPDFWAAMWDFVGIIASRWYDEVIDDVTKMP